MRWDESSTANTVAGRAMDLPALLHALDRLPDVIWAAGADRIFTYVSAGSELLLGYRPEELIGRSSGIVMHESSAHTFEEGYAWQIAHPDGDQTYRVNLRHRDGHPVPVELHNVGTPIAGGTAGGPAPSARSPRRFAWSARTRSRPPSWRPPASERTSPTSSMTP